MNNIPEPIKPIEPFQHWLNQKCIWAEDHQLALFACLEIVLILIACAGKFCGAINPWTAVGIGCYGIHGLVTGIIAAKKNRHIWFWGLVMGAVPGSPFVVLSLAPLSRKINHVE